MIRANYIETLHNYAQKVRNYSNDPYTEAKISSLALSTENTIPENSFDYKKHSILLVIGTISYVSDETLQWQSVITSTTIHEKDIQKTILIAVPDYHYGTQSVIVNTSCTATKARLLSTRGECEGSGCVGASSRQALAQTARLHPSQLLVRAV